MEYKELLSLTMKHANRRKERTEEVANCKLHLPCIAFPVTEIKRKPQDKDTYEIKTDGLNDLLITTEAKLIQFSPETPTLQKFLLVRPWNRRVLDLPGPVDHKQHVEDCCVPGSLDSEFHSRALQLLVRLGQPFRAFLLVQEHGEEYKRIAPDREIILQVKDMASVHHMMDVRTLDILPGINMCEAPPCTLPYLSEDKIQTLVSSLRSAVTVELASKLYTTFDNLSAPRFTNRRLHLPCIVFRATEIRRRHGQTQDSETHFTYGVKADGLHGLLITTEETLIQFSPARPPLQTFLLVHPWTRDLLELPDPVDDTQSVEDLSVLGSPLQDSPGGSAEEIGSVDSESEESHLRALRLIVRLGQPFRAFLLARQHGGEYKRIASDYDIIAQVKDASSVHDMMDVRTMDIL
ncbi:hypothetical protein DFH29DRAFT_580527 [Suillus ampliporus]|nr:hypothetical protein DFH29DRAFT_580527 [Suillus ampliporus]